jgi:hypothetical protein
MSYADVNGLSLYYEEQGSGEPLILLHGGIGSGDMFVGILPDLAAGRRVITVDRQGHGRTADIDRPFSPELMADDIAALAGHLGLGLLGGGLRDAGWDNANRPTARLAILPGATHYDVFMSPLLAPAVIAFLDAA